MPVIPEVNLTSMVIDAVTKALDPTALDTRVQEQIEKTLTETINKVLEKSLSCYFGKQLEKQVQDSLKIETLKIPSYNHAILKFCEETLSRATMDVVKKQVADRMKELLEPTPETIKLSELVEMYRKEQEDSLDAGCHCEGQYGNIVVEYDSDDNSTSGLHDLFKNLQLWESRESYKPGSYSTKTKSDPDLYIGLSIQGKTAAEGLPIAHIYHLRFKHGDVTDKMFVGPFYNFERAIFQMKAGSTKIIIDQTEDFETSYSDHED